ncbi:Transient receptor putative cation channel sub M member 2 [Branchiostoma belcheri]|nr:Transient receptor putative cation channel sub M member 2 [Branchiostoma belcheri]
MSDATLVTIYAGSQTCIEASADFPWHPRVLLAIGQTKLPSGSTPPYHRSTPPISDTFINPFSGDRAGSSEAQPRAVRRCVCVLPCGRSYIDTVGPESYWIRYDFPHKKNLTLCLTAPPLNQNEYDDWFKSAQGLESGENVRKLKCDKREETSRRYQGNMFPQPCSISMEREPLMKRGHHGYRLVSEEVSMEESLSRTLTIREDQREKLELFVKDRGDGNIKSYGEIYFSGFGNLTQTSPFVKVTPAVDPAVLWDLMMKHWHLKKPSLIVSVAGGAQKFFLKNRLKDAFIRSLMKASQSTDAWILTGGTNSGIMKCVGEAVRDQVSNFATSPVAIGIATWGSIDNRKSLEPHEAQRKDVFPAIYSSDSLKFHKGTAPLDLNHTHFILVDDGSAENFGDADITLRTKLCGLNTTPTLGDMKGLGVPVVVLVVEGGRYTLKEVSEAVKRKIPVVVAEGSGRAADIIAYAYKRRRRIKQKGKLSKDLWDRVCKAFDHPSDEEKQTQAAEMIFDIVNNSTFVTLFKLEEGDTVNIDEALLRGLLKAEKSHPKNQLQLALAWDRSDIARQEIFTPSRRQKLQDRVEFVQLLLDNGVELLHFLTVKRLHKLYHETIEDGGADGVARLLQRLVRHEWGKKQWELLGGKDKDTDKGYKANLLHMIARVVRRLLSYQMKTMYNPARRRSQGSTSSFRRQSDVPDEVDFPAPDTTDGPETDLFLWAVLTNKKDMARLFWRMGSDHIAAALSASKILMSLADLAKNEEQLVLYQDLMEHARQLECDARGVLEDCHQKNRSQSHDLLVRRQDRWGDVTAMAIAASSQHMTFMSHDACQTKMNLVWKGRMASFTQWWKIVLSLVFLPAIFWITFVDDDERDKKRDTTATDAPDRDSFDRKLCKVKVLPCEKTEGRIGLLKAIYFQQTAPVSRFIYNAMFHVLYLWMFSVFLLTDLRPGVISPWEWFLSVVMASLMIEELRQVATEHPPNWWYKLRAWYRSMWNRMDFVLLLSFAFSLTLHISMGESSFEAARVVYSVTLILMFYRLLQMFLVQKDVGPKIVMIKGMLKDLAIFMFVLLVFILAYGVARLSLISPDSTLGWHLLVDVFRIPYWQMYGDLFTDDDGNVSGPRFVSFLQAVYMLVTNVLLLNLLIAMFNYTFQKIQDESEVHWKYQRYFVIEEYVSRPWGPPPLILLGHVWRLAYFMYRRKGSCSGPDAPRSTDFDKTFEKGKVQKLRDFERLGAENYLLREHRARKHAVDDRNRKAHQDEKFQELAWGLDEIREDMDELKKQLHATSKQLNAEAAQQPKTSMPWLSSWGRSFDMDVPDGPVDDPDLATDGIESYIENYVTDEEMSSMDEGELSDSTEPASEKSDDEEATEPGPPVFRRFDKASQTTYLPYPSTACQLLLRRAIIALHLPLSSARLVAPPSHPQPITTSTEPASERSDEEGGTEPRPPVRSTDPTSEPKPPLRRLTSRESSV